MDLLDKFLAQMGQLQTVWAPFIIALFVVGVVIWRVLKHHYQGRLDTKDDLIKLRDAQLQDYKDKLSGATPDAAKARMDALESRLDALGPRRITPEQRNRMLAVLMHLNGQFVEIASDAASADSGQLAHALADVFRQAGWVPTVGMMLGLGNPPQSGISLGVPDPANLTAAQRAIASALDAAGLAYDRQAHSLSPAMQGQPQAAAMLVISSPREQ